MERYFSVGRQSIAVPKPTDHTAFERSLTVGTGGAVAVGLLFLSLSILGLALADVVIAVGILLVPFLAVLTYYRHGGRTADLGYYADQYWRERYPHWYGEEAADQSSRDADSLATLRERYARGELTEAQFERKLDVLLNTETRENAAEWRRSGTERTLEEADQLN